MSKISRATHLKWSLINVVPIVMTLLISLWIADRWEWFGNGLIHFSFAEKMLVLTIFRQEAIRSMVMEMHLHVDWFSTRKSVEPILRNVSTM